MYASSLVKSRPKGAGQTYKIICIRKQAANHICGAETHHGGTAISGDFALGAEILSSGFVYRQIASKSPLRPADRFSGLVKLGSHVEVVDRRLASNDSIEADERVDLEVGEMEIYVDRVKADEEVDESVAFSFWDVFEEGGGDHVTGGEGAMDGDGEDESFGVDIADFDSSFVGEEDRVALAGGVDADVVFCV